MPIRSCTVTFRDRHGVTRSADVDAVSVYEAAALALKAFASKRWKVGPSRHTVLDISVDGPRIFRVRVQDVWTWLYSGRGTEEQRRRKKYLANLLADQRH